MTRTQYFEMCEQMGNEPIEEEIPLDYEDLDEESQYALLLFKVLPDIVEGNSGTYIGKDFSGLSDVMKLYGIEENKVIFELLQICIDEYSEHSRQEKDRRDKLNKASSRTNVKR